MHSRWISLRPLAFVVLLTVIQAGASESGRTNSILWGDVKEGMQLGVKPDNRAGVVHCWIRNATTSDLAYNDYFLGVAGSVQLEIWLAESWRAIRFNRGYVTLLSAGPSSYDNQVAAAQGIIRKNSRKPLLLPMRPQPSLARAIVATNQPLSNAQTIIFGGEFTNHPFYKAMLADGTVTVPQDMPIASTNDSTFGVDILYLKWPTETLSQNTIRARVTQWLCKPLTNGFSYNSEGFQLQSPAFEMDMHYLRGFLQKAGSTDSIAEKK